MPDQNGSQNPTANSDTEPQSQPPMSPSTPQQYKMGQPGDQSSKDTEDPSAKLERDIKIGEICLIVINGLLLITTIIIVKIYYGQLEEMRKATVAAQISAEASRKASDTAAATLLEIQKGSGDTHELAVQAKNQADIARDTLNLDQRAWVGAVGLEVVTLEKDKPIIATARILNSGKTVAVNMQIAVWIGVTRQPPPPHLVHNRLNTMKSVNALFPSQGIDASASIPPNLGNGVIDHIKNKREFLYFYGTITYFDVFKIEHTTNFCGMFDGEKSFLSCSIGNDAN